jgi:hypothetical protein
MNSKYNICVVSFMGDSDIRRLWYSIRDKIHSIILESIKKNPDENFEKGKLRLLWDEIKDWGVAAIELNNMGFETHELTEVGKVLVGYYEVDESLGFIENNRDYSVGFNFNEDLGCLHISWDSYELD